MDRPPVPSPSREGKRGHPIPRFSHSRFSGSGKVGFLAAGGLSTGNACRPSEVVACPRVPSQRLRVRCRVSHFSHSCFFGIGKSGFFQPRTRLHRECLSVAQVLSQGPDGGESNFPIFPLPRFSGVGKVGFWPGRGPFAGDDSRTRVPKSSPKGPTGARRISRFSHFRRIGRWTARLFLITAPPFP